MGIVAKQFNFQAYFFIQPIPGYRNNYLNHIFIPKNISPILLQNKMAAMSLLEETVDHKTAFSLTSLLENYEHQPFVDDCHYTTKLLDLIAKKIACKIKIPEQTK